LVVDLDVEFDVAGVHTGDSNVDAVGLTGIRQFVLKPNAREEPVRSRTQCVPNTKRPPRRNQETASESDAMTTICVSKRSSPGSLRRAALCRVRLDPGWRFEYDAGVGWPEGVSPSGSHRSRRDNLSSPGSCHPVHQEPCTDAQWAKSLGCWRVMRCQHALAFLMVRSRLYLLRIHRIT